MKSRWVLLGLLLLTSCSVLNSSHVEKTINDALSTSAGYYFLPTAKLNFEVHEQRFNDNTDGKKIIYYLKYLSLSLEPDPKHLYRIDYMRNPFAHDLVTVTLTTKGLLDKVDVTTTDQSGALVVKLVDIAKAAVTKIPPPSGRLSLEEDIVIATVTIDPIADCDNSPRKLFYGASCKISASVFGSPEIKQNGTPECDKGICFRPVLPYEITLSNSEGNLTSRFIAMLPNKAPIFELPVTRTAFIKKVTELDFENGILTQVKIDKPSEVVGALDIPLAVARAILSIPAELIQLKIDTTKSQFGLVKAQKDLIEANQALLELQKQFSESSQDGGNAPD